MKGLRESFQQAETVAVHFEGCCYVGVDTLTSAKERVVMTMKNSWKVTGYRWK